MKLITVEDTIIKLGTNKKENWDMLKTNKNFIWMHLNSFPSGYIIIENENPDENILQQAGIFCKENTKYKNMRNIKVCYTTVGNVIKGDNTGEVYFKSNRKLQTIIL